MSAPGGYFVPGEHGQRGGRGDFGMLRAHHGGGALGDQRSSEHGKSLAIGQRAARAMNVSTLGAFGVLIQ